MGVEREFDRFRLHPVWITVGAAGAPAFQNSWVNYGGDEATAQFCKDAWGFVHLQGMLKSGTIGQTVFVLPVGYRPLKTIVRTTYSTDGGGMVVAAVVAITATGAVTAAAGSSAAFGINDISFYAG